MSYEQREQSTELGSPQYLYTFSLNDKTWRYVNTASPVYVLGQQFEAVSIADDGTKQKGDPVSEVLNITCQADLEVVKLFHATPPSSTVVVRIQRHHVGDDDAAICFVGEVVNADLSRPGQAVLSCNTLGASLERNGIRLSWSRNCPFSVYDSSCKADKSAHAAAVRIIGIEDEVLTIDSLTGFDDNYFNGGMAEWTDPLRGLERRAIELQTGDTLYMFGTSDGLSVGQDITVYPGCDRIAQTCRDKFNNLPNFGGVPSMPSKSPFDGDPIY